MMEYTLQLIHRLEILIQEHVVDAGVEPADVQQNISKTIALQVKQILGSTNRLWIIANIFKKSKIEKKIRNKQ